MLGKSKHKSKQVEKKRSYVCPKLTCFGEVKSLTAGGSALGFEQPDPDPPAEMVGNMT